MPTLPTQRASVARNVQRPARLRDAPTHMHLHRAHRDEGSHPLASTRRRVASATSERQLGPTTVPKLGSSESSTSEKQVLQTHDRRRTAAAPVGLGIGEERQ